jgi:hypothetical protein
MARVDTHPIQMRNWTEFNLGKRNGERCQGGRENFVLEFGNGELLEGWRARDALLVLRKSNELI